MESPSYFLPDVAIGNSSLLLPRRGSVFSVYMYCFQANLSSFFFYFFFLSSPLPDFAAKLPVEGVGNARSSWETGRSARSYIKLIFVGERSLIIRLIGNIEWEREREREREWEREIERQGQDQRGIISVAAWRRYPVSCWKTGRRTGVESRFGRRERMTQYLLALPSPSSPASYSITKWSTSNPTATRLTTPDGELCTASRNFSSHPPRRVHPVYTAFTFVACALVYTLVRPWYINLFPSFLRSLRFPCIRDISDCHELDGVWAFLMAADTFAILQNVRVLVACWRL